MSEAHRLDASINELRAEYKYQIELGNTARAKMIDEMYSKLIWIKNRELQDLADLDATEFYNIQS